MSRKKTARRKPRGKPFEKGKSGNPHGVPAWFKELRALAGSHAPAAIERLAQLMRSRKNLTVARAAAEALLDRAGLKPYALEPDRIELSGDGSLGEVILARLAALRSAGGAAGAGAQSDAGAAPGARGGDAVAPAARPAD